MPIWVCILIIPDLKLWVFMFISWPLTRVVLITYILFNLFILFLWLILFRLSGFFNFYVECKLKNVFFFQAPSPTPFNCPVLAFASLESKTLKLNLGPTLNSPSDPCAIKTSTTPSTPIVSSFERGYVRIEWNKNLSLSLSLPVDLTINR